MPRFPTYLQRMKESGRAKDARAYMRTSRRLLPKAWLQKQEELACAHDKKERRRTKGDREGLQSVYEGRLRLKTYDDLLTDAKKR